MRVRKCIHIVHERTSVRITFRSEKMWNKSLGNAQVVLPSVLLYSMCPIKPALHVLVMNHQTVLGTSSTKYMGKKLSWKVSGNSYGANMDKPNCNNLLRPGDFQPASIDLDDNIHDVMYLDMQKLFDKVPYQGLVKYFSCQGGREMALAWIN